MPDDYDVAVIGGGPAGGLAGGLIAKAGHRVAILEEHPSIGEPVQCAGLITPRCFDLLGYGSDTVLNDIRGAHIHAPSGRTMSIGREEKRAVVVDRPAFDRMILDRAADSGADIIRGKRVTGFRRKRDGTVALNGGEITARLVVGADGARSAARRWLGLKEPTFLLNGFGADVAGADIEPDRVTIFFGRDVAPNFFAWMIPAGDVTRVGLCVRDGKGTVHDYFKKLFGAGESARFLKNAKLLKSYSGMIPLGMLPRTHGDRGMVVGDAACQVKATSGGGIFPGLVCAGHCAGTAIKALEAGDCSAKALSAYHDAWMSGIGDELGKAFMMHRIYVGLNDAQLEDMFGMMLNPEIQEIINTVGDIDYPSRLAWALLRKEPGLLRYAGKFLRHGVLKI